jgi:hypothetical protein
MIHSVVRFEEKNLALPPGYERHAAGYRSCSSKPGGFLEQNVPAYEKAIFVLAGEVDIMLDACAYHLVSVAEANAYSSSEAKANSYSSSEAEANSSSAGRPMRRADTSASREPGCRDRR